MKKVIVLILALVVWPAVVTADRALNMQLQRFLNALGYDVGAVDGIVGKNTKAQLNNALSEYGYTFDGSVDDDEIKILKSIARKKGIQLSERMIGITRRHLEQIMDKQTAQLFVPSNRNTDRVDAFEIVEFEGRTAAKMSVSMDDRGHVDDWGRFGVSGEAQRVQIQEKPKVHEMVDGKLYWYKFSVFIPAQTGSNYHTISPFDLKDRKNGSQRDPAIAFTITNNQVTFQLKRDGEECRQVKNSAGGTSEFCERPGIIANMMFTNDFKDKWLDFVFMLDMRIGSEITKFWINEKLVGVINGDLSPQGRYLGFKFGPYRNSIKKSPKDEVLYFSDIMRTNSCEKLQNVDCEKLYEAQNLNGMYGVQEMLLCFKEPQQGRPCPMICRGRNCEKLGG
jgi:hypothetical protein